MQIALSSWVFIWGTGSLGFTGQLLLWPYYGHETRSVVDNLENFGHNIAIMGRPRKAGQLLMDAYLRIPVTGEQKQIIMKATGDEPEGMSARARSVLLEAAKR